MDVASVLNKDVVTDFPLAEAVGKLQPGVYLVTARPWKGTAAPNADNPDNGDDSLATQWMVVSDLGLTALSGDDGVHAMARSLATAAPIEGVEMRLIARNNEVLAIRKTGADGRVDFDPGLSRGVGGSALGLLVASLGDDYGFLNLTQSPFDLTDRGVSGRDAPGALDAFLYTERGVYRSGETVFVTALLRDAKGVAKPGLPLTLVVKRPDGVEYKRASVPDQGLGGRALAVALVADAAPGKWSIDAYADPKGPSLGHTEFLLEDYVPERLDFTLKSAKTVATPGEPIEVSLDAKFLYGAPASGLAVTGAIRLQAVAGSELVGYPGYVGGLTDDEFTAIESQFTEAVDTDEKGHADLSIALPEGGAAKPLEARIIVDVAESGGRTVERVITLPVRAKGATIGVKEDFDESLGEGDSAKFEVIAIGADGARIPRKGVAWSLYKINNDYQWYNTDGRWSYEPVKSSRRIADGIVDIRRRRPGQDRRAGRLGPPPARSEIARRRRDQRQLRCRLVRHGERGHPGQRGRHAGQDQLRAGRGSQTAHRLARRRQGDGRTGGRQIGAVPRRRSRRRRQCRAVQGRRRLGRGRLCGRDHLPSARRESQAHARPRAGARLVRHRLRRAQARSRDRRSGKGASTREARAADQNRRIGRRERRPRSRSPPSISAF